MNSVYLVEGARTAFTSFGGSFVNTNAVDLGVRTAEAALERANVSADAIDHVIYGNVIHTSENAAYLSRHIGLKAGVPQDVPALTLNRLCGSGLQSVVSAAQEIKLDEANIVLAGGAENMSQAPFSNFKQRFKGVKMGELSFTDTLNATLTDQYTGEGMGMTAEKLSEQYGISRAAQDEYAAQSHQRASDAVEKGYFAEEIMPVTVKSRKGNIEVEQDEHIKPDSSLDVLSSLKPVFKQEGTVTAANSSGINDGASSVVVAGEKAVRDHGLVPIAEIKSWHVAGVDPTVMGIGPVPAIQGALKKAGLTLDDMDLVEVNEAFAAQYLAVEAELGLDRNKTNVNGGAIALGHPVGVSGTRVLLTAAYELKRRGGKYAVVSLCIGGGQGIAMVIENQ
ncbi:thiolase family protein [Alkalibacillus salilacus]|uniref:acetyl-CoA C-acetyltransferase n=1 Tax=Alkalibacillus salilacus TaxID=284582 RepID=A0ABT9VHC8_9BACI|nr:acetyl-CoA C-acetyltransferase [Alkalibacillus salilacus]MDQ0160265.1 acetyl-CoA acetyltransferase family protein [Alkalibacillus salilacus]